RFVIGARDDALVVGTDGDAAHRVAVPLQRANLNTGRSIPDDRLFVVGAGHDPLAVAADGNATDGQLLRLGRRNDVAARAIPYLDALVLVHRSNARSVEAHCNAGDRTGWARKR